MNAIFTTLGSIECSAVCTEAWVHPRLTFIFIKGKVQILEHNVIVHVM